MPSGLSMGSISTLVTLQSQIATSFLGQISVADLGEGPGEPNCGILLNYSCKIMPYKVIESTFSSTII